MSSSATEVFDILALYKSDYYYHYYYYSGVESGPRRGSSGFADQTRTSARASSPLTRTVRRLAGTTPTRPWAPILAATRLRRRSRHPLLPTRRRPSA